MGNFITKLALSICALAVPCAALATTINGVCYGNPSSSIPPGTFDPNDPGKSGYSLVFDSEFNNFNDFDLTCPSAPSSAGCQTPQGKNWYLNSWTFPNRVTHPGDLAIQSGILSIHQSELTGNWAITTMGPHGGASHGPAQWQQNWNGAVYGGGWYAETRMAGEWRDNATGNIVHAPGGSNGHPSFWAYAEDHFVGPPTDQWPGQAANYTHFVEDDMIDGYQGDAVNEAFYQTNFLDWYGTNQSSASAVGTGMNGNNQVNVTLYGFPGNAWSNKTFHNVGQLWVPATASTQGYLQNYLDGVPTSRFSWSLYNPNTPPPPTGANIGSIIDEDHLQVILGADGNHAGDNPVTSTMYADWVHVWQLPAAANASGNTIITPQANFTGGNGSCAGSSPPPPPR
jgi:hypothetical protein